MRFFRRKKRDIEQEKMEKKLEATLIRIEPRQKFVRDLRSRLLTRFDAHAPEPVTQQEEEISPGWLVAGGVVGTVLMLIMSVRGLLSIAGLIGLLIRYFSHRKQEPASQLAR